MHVEKEIPSNKNNLSLWLNGLEAVDWVGTRFAVNCDDVMRIVRTVLQLFWQLPWLCVTCPRGRLSLAGRCNILHVLSLMRNHSHHHPHPDTMRPPSSPLIFIPTELRVCVSLSQNQNRTLTLLNLVRPSTRKTLSQAWLLCGLWSALYAEVNDLFIGGNVQINVLFLGSEQALVSTE